MQTDYPGLFVRSRAQYIKPLERKNTQSNLWKQSSEVQIFQQSREVNSFSYQFRSADCFYLIYTMKYFAVISIILALMLAVCSVQGASKCTARFEPVRINFIHLITISSLNHYPIFESLI